MPILREEGERDGLVPLFAPVPSRESHLGVSGHTVEGSDAGRILFVKT